MASFLLQTSPEGQPIYEEIPQGQLLTSSDHSSDHYVDTTSGYHTLPLDNEYSESETGLFLVPVNSHNKPLILNKDFQVPGGKTNKKFFTFHKKSLETNKNPKSRNDHDVVNSNFLNQFETLDNKVPTKQQQPKKTKCGKSFVHSKTLDINNQNHYNFQNINANQHPRAVYRATYQPTTLNTRLGRPGLNGVSRGTPILQHSARTQPSTLSRKNSSTIQRQNQDNFLPRTAWTDTSGSDDWLDVANDNKNDKSGGGTTHQNVPSTMGNYSHYERPVCPSPPDLISNKCRTTSASPSNISTSDVTVSPSSSESYPECRFWGLPTHISCLFNGLSQVLIRGEMFIPAQHSHKTPVDFQPSFPSLIWPSLDLLESWAGGKFVNWGESQPQKQPQWSGTVPFKDDRKHNNGPPVFTVMTQL